MKKIDRNFLASFASLRLCGFFILFLSTVEIAQSQIQPLTVRDIMREPSIAGMRPESERISPDGKFVVYSWNAEGREPRNLYWVSTSVGASRILVNAEQNFEQRTAPAESKLNYGLEVRDEFVKAREKNLFGVDISPDSKRILFLQNTDIYVLDLETVGANPRRITRTQGSETSARWLTNGSILYQSGGNFFVLNLKETSLVQVTKEANLPAFISIFNATPTDSGKLLAYVVSDGSKQKALFVPNYLDDFVQSPSVRRGWTEQKIFVAPTDGSREKPFEINLPKAEGVSYIRSMKWAADNSSLVIDRIDRDTKRRQIFFIHDVGSKLEQIIFVTEETDEKWIAPLSRLVEPNPKDASKMFFASERDGFNHLYLAKLTPNKSETNTKGEIRAGNPASAGNSLKVEIEQRTSGEFQIEWAKWFANGNDILYSSTELGTATREFYVIETEDEDNPQEWKVEDDEKPMLGMKTNAQMETSEDSVHLIFRYSQWNKPDELFYQKLCYRCKDGKAFPKSFQLTKTTPNLFLQRKWSEPNFISIPTRDGKNLKAKIYLPHVSSPRVSRGAQGQSLQKPARSKDVAAQKLPLVIFVHGAGYLQNVINGWNNYYREFMFHTILVDKGFAVLDIDYRGSAGYGRDWRTDVYDFLGGKDFDDHIDAIDFAVKNFNVDPNRVGVYGGSYGGFMAEMLAMRAPEKIACAAALRPVADWKNYYASSPIYTTERLGFPEKNPEGYKRSSPISYADKLQRPLLILHGMVDDNVHAQDSVQLIEKLIRLEKTKYFEAMLYPSENHGFQRPTSWTDEYERILMFFEKHLK